MKRLLILLIFLPIFAQAQTATLDGLYKTYSEQQGVQAKKVGRMMIMAAKAMSDDVPKGLESVMVIGVEDCSKLQKGVEEAMNKEIKSIVSQSKYFLITQKEEQGYKVNIYSKTPAGSDTLSDIVLYIKGNGKLSLVCMNGEFSKDDKFVKEMESFKTE